MQPPNGKGYLESVFSLLDSAIQEVSSHVFLSFNRPKIPKTVNMISYGLLTNTDWAKGPLGTLASSYFPLLLTQRWMDCGPYESEVMFGK